MLDSYVFLYCTASTKDTRKRRHQTFMNDIKTNKSLPELPGTQANNIYKLELGFTKIFRP